MPISAAETTVAPITQAQAGKWMTAWITLLILPPLSALMLWPGSGFSFSFIVSPLVTNVMATF
jgi:hypothetical protein